MSKDGSLLTVLHALDRRIAEVPERIALRWLERGRIAEELDYAQLGRRVRAVRAQLSPIVQAGDRVMVVFEPGIGFVVAFLATLSAGGVAVPVYPPTSRNTHRGVRVVDAIAKSCNPGLVLISPAVARLRSSSNAAEWPELRYLCARDDVLSPTAAATTTGALQAGAGPECLAGPSVDDLAFLQFTSGSTGNPKGVMVAHANLMANFGAMLACPSIGGGAARDGFVSCVSWLPLYHDMGLVQNLLLPLYTGGVYTGMSPVDFLSDPLGWLEAISTWRPNMLSCPNFAFDLLARKWDTVRARALDLTCISHWHSGAEPVRRASMRALAACMERSGVKWEVTFRTAYGMAESVVAISAHTHPLQAVSTVDPDAVPSGTVTRPGFPSVAIVDVETCRRVAEKVVGEIWAQHGSVGRGYWGLPELSEQTFRATCPDLEGTWLRTGDLGWVEDGNLYIAGRLKDLIIVRGRNLWPQDIEACVHEADARVRPGCVIAFAWADAEQGTEQCVVVAEVRKGKEAEAESMLHALRAHLLREMQLEPHALVLIKQGTLPKTTSGKVRRTQCRIDWQAGKLDSIMSWQGTREVSIIDWTWLEQWCADHAWDEARQEEWRQVFTRFGLTVGDAAVGDQGLDSLQTAELLGVLQPFAGGNALSIGHVISLTPLQMLDMAITGTPPSASQPDLEEYPQVEEEASILPKWPEPAFGMGGRVAVELTSELALLCTLVAAAVPSVGWYRLASEWESPWGAWDLSSGSRVRLAQGFALALIFPLWLVGLTVLIVVQKWLIWGRFKPARVGWNTARWARWHYVDKLLYMWEAWAFPWVADTVIAVAVYRLLGARLSWSAAIKVPLPCPDLVEVGSDSEVDGRLCPQQLVQQGVELARITLGRHVSIGTNAVVHRGTRIAEGSCIAPLSVVRPYSRLDGAGSWYGNPVRRLAAASAQADASASREEKTSSTWRRAAHEIAKLVVLSSQLVVATAVGGAAARIWDEWESISSIPDSRWPLYLALNYTMFVGTCMLVAIASKWCLHGRASPGPYKMTTWRTLTRMFTARWHDTAAMLFMSMDWAVTHLYMRALGMRFGDGVASVSRKCHPADADLVTIGRAVFVSLADFRPYDSSRQERRRIELEEGSEVGLDAVLDAGVTCRQRSVVGAQCYVLPGTEVPPGTTQLTQGTQLRGMTGVSGRRRHRRTPCWLYPVDVAMSVVLLAAMWGSLWLPLWGARHFAGKIEPQVGSLSYWLVLVPILATYGLAIQCAIALLHRVPGTAKNGSTLLWAWRLRISLFWIGIADVFWAGTERFNWMWRMSGVKVGSDCRLFSPRFADPQLTEFGTGTVVNRDCIVSGHIWERGRMVFAPCVIGSGCTLETSARIWAGRQFPQRAVLTSRSVIITQLTEEGKVYLGNPASAHTPHFQSAVAPSSQADQRV